MLTSWMYSLHIWTGALKFVHQQWVAIRSTIDISIPKSTQGTFQAEGTCVYMARLSTSNFRGISPKATHTTKGFEHDTIDTICTIYIYLSNKSWHHDEVGHFHDHRHPPLSFQHFFGMPVIFIVGTSIWMVCTRVGGTSIFSCWLYYTSWWFQPLWKILVQLEIFSNFSGWK